MLLNNFFLKKEERIKRWRNTLIYKSYLFILSSIHSLIVLIMNKTKLKIIETAVQLMNQNGISNVSLKQIADEIKISPGNLTYHFKLKSDLMESIHQQMVEEMEGVIRPLGMVGLEHFEKSIRFAYQFQERYRFFFLDLVEIVRMYPKISERHNIIVKKRMEEGRALLNYYIGGGWLIPEPEEGRYDTIIQQIWFMNTFWLSLQVVIKEQNYDKEAILSMIWTVLKPYFTEKGKADFLILRNRQN